MSRTLRSCHGLCQMLIVLFAIGLGTYSGSSFAVVSTLHSPWWFASSSYDADAYVEIKNTTSHTKTVTLLLYPGNNPVVTKTFTLCPHGVVHVRLLDYEAELGGALYGGAELSYDPPTSDVVANITTFSYPYGHSFDSPFSDPTEYPGGTIHSPWWFVSTYYNVDAFIEIKNTKSVPITVDPRIYVAGGDADGIIVPSIILAPHVTTYIRLSDYQSQFGNAPFYYGGVEIYSEPGSGAVVANITTLDYGRGLSFDSPFSDPNLIVSPTLYSPWWYVSSLYDVNAYIEYKNTTVSTITVYTRLRPFGRVAQDLPALTLGPHQTGYYDLLSYLTDTTYGLYGGAEISSSGVKGSVVANITTQNVPAGQSFDSPFVDRLWDLTNVLHSPNWEYSRAAGWNGYFELKNTINSSVTVTTTLYPLDCTSIALGSMTLGPYETRYFDLQSYESLLGTSTAGGAEVVHNGVLGAVVGNITNLNSLTGESFDAPLWSR